MPIYEYQCDHCGKIEEALQKVSDRPLTQCRRCSGKLHKLISHSAFHLKGTGWYVTDYAGKNQEKTNKTDDSASPKNAKSSDSKASGSSAKSDNE